MIPVMPVLLFAADPQGCDPQGRTGSVPSGRQCPPKRSQRDRLRSREAEHGNFQASVSSFLSILGSSQVPSRAILRRYPRITRAGTELSVPDSDIRLIIISSPASFTENLICTGCLRSALSGTGSPSLITDKIRLNQRIINR